MQFKLELTTLLPNTWDHEIATRHLSGNLIDELSRCHINELRQQPVVGCIEMLRQGQGLVSRELTQSMHCSEHKHETRVIHIVLGAVLFALQIPKPRRAVYVED